ncbi:MAG: hypothetical protein ACYTFK_13455 [Planctomycetota bacterium]|jgi:hypothetical protein
MKLREAISRIAQGNIQEVLNPIVDRIEAIEEALDSMKSGPEVVQEPDENYLNQADAVILNKDAIVKVEVAEVKDEE